MGIKHITLGLFIGALAAGCSSEPEELPEDYVSRSGKEIYEKRCIVCHGPDGKLGASNAKDLSVSTSDDARIEKLINKGGTGMPRQKQYIKTDEEMANIIEYVKSLRK